jgi:hypothetical protein
LRLQSCHTSQMCWSHGMCHRLVPTPNVPRKSRPVDPSWAFGPENCRNLVTICQTPSLPALFCGGVSVREQVTRARMTSPVLGVTDLPAHSPWALITRNRDTLRDTRRLACSWPDWPDAGAAAGVGPAIGGETRGTSPCAWSPSTLPESAPGDPNPGTAKSPWEHANGAQCREARAPLSRASPMIRSLAVSDGTPS